VTVRRSPRLPLEALAPVMLTVPDPPAPLDWRTVFGNDNPVELEVGFGKGLFLLTAAQQSPDVNFLGIEIVRKYQLFTATRLVKHSVGNVRVACADARSFLRDCIAADYVRALHVYFPDPWWKTRHHKRRVFTSEFCSEIVRVLCPGGRLYFATDVEDYSRRVVELIASHTSLLTVPAPTEHDPAHDLDYLTNFERKFRKQGKQINRLCFAKDKNPSCNQDAADSARAAVAEVRPNSTTNGK
jgi:tRNA (guanine-N7-)-methyltransferase